MSKIIGIIPTRFTAKNGDQISGTTIYLTTPIDPKRGKGEESERVFLSTAKCEALDFQLVVGIEVEVLFNRFGKVQILRQVDERIDFGTTDNAP